jgi:alpha-methylacyl-CoA racemase
MLEAGQHPHLVERGTYVELDGVPHPAPAPRFSATPAAIDTPPAGAGEHTRSVLLDLGFSGEELADLQAAGVLPAWA